MDRDQVGVIGRFRTPPVTPTGIRLFCLDALKAIMLRVHFYVIVHFV